ncbi:hypothetical protein F4824DRAFT_36769 [Ustulina deusta]|nr:hypothetical protein F4824DRAFT_36769 [Ustulina deusta]
MAGISWLLNSHPKIRRVQPTLRPKTGRMRRKTKLARPCLILGGFHTPTKQHSLCSTSAGVHAGRRMSRWDWAESSCALQLLAATCRCRMVQNDLGWGLDAAALPLGRIGRRIEASRLFPKISNLYPPLFLFPSILPTFLLPLDWGFYLLASSVFLSLSLFHLSRLLVACRQSLPIPLFLSSTPGRVVLLLYLHYVQATLYFLLECWRLGQLSCTDIEDAGCICSIVV